MNLFGTPEEIEAKAVAAAAKVKAEAERAAQEKAWRDIAANADLDGYAAELLQGAQNHAAAFMGAWNPSWDATAPSGGTRSYPKDAQWEYRSRRGWLSASNGGPTVFYFEVPVRVTFSARNYGPARDRSDMEVPFMLRTGSGLLSVPAFFGDPSGTEATVASVRAGLEKALVGSGDHLFTEGSPGGLPRFSFELYARKFKDLNVELGFSLLESDMRNALETYALAAVSPEEE